ncbi:MAG TPA: chromate transporter [Enterococcus columbae]|nr:chromate transporter [Enterococcus columbae]
MIEWQLFYSFIKVGLFSFGGGYAALPLIHNEVVLAHHWLTENEFNNLVTISQMTPGPIAINAATFVGIKVNGVQGALTATLGCVLPSCIIVTILSLLYMKYRSLKVMKIILATLRPVVIALIALAGWSIFKSTFTFSKVTIVDQFTAGGFIVIFFVSFYLLFRYKKQAIGIMFLAGIVNILFQLLCQVLF